MATRPINININYNASVTRALRAGQEVLDQMRALEQLQLGQLASMRRIEKALEDFGNTGKASINKVAEATRSWGIDLTRVGVFANKTFASIAGAVQSFGTQIGRVFSTAGSGVSNAGSAASNFITNFSKSITDFVGGGGFIQELSRAVAVGAGGIVKVGVKIGESLIQGIGTALSQLPKVIGELVKIQGAVGGLFVGLGSVFFKAGGIAGGLLVSGIANAAGAVVSSFGNVLQGVTDLASSTFGAVGGIIADSLEGAISIIGAFADRAATLISDVAGKIGDTFGKAFAVAVGIAIPVGFKASTFRDQLGATFGVILDEVSEQGFQQLVNDSKQVAIDIGLSLSQVPDALFRTVSPGFRGATQTIKDFRAAAKLAAIGNVEIAEAIGAANRVLAAYGETAGDVESVLVKLFNATRVGQLEVFDLTNNIGLVAGAAAQARIPIDDLFTVINLAAEGLPASRVMTGLANSLKALNKPSEDARKAFGSFFNAVRDGTGGIISFRRVLEELESTGIINDPEAFRRLFPDERGARAILQAYQKAGEGLTNYGERFKIVSANAEAFNTATDFALNTVFRNLNSLSSAIISVGDDFLEKFKDPIIAGIKAVVAGLGSLGDRIRNIDPSIIEEFTKNVVRFFESIPERAEKAFSFLSGLVDSIGNAVSAAKKLADEFLNFSDIISNLGDGNLSGAVDALFGSRAAAEVKGFFNTLVDDAKNAFQTIKEIGGIVFQELGNAAGTILKGLPLVGGFGGDSLSLEDIGGKDVADFLLQTAVGVNPIQSAARTTTTTAISAGAGATAGGAVGFALAGPPGLAIGALIGGIGAGLAAWFSSVEETKKAQDAISNATTEIAARVAEQAKLAAERRALFQKNNRLFTEASLKQNEAATVAARIAAIEARRAEKIASLNARRESAIEREGKLFDRLNAFEAENGGGGGAEEIIKARIESRSLIEITNANEARAAEVTKRANIIRERIEDRLRDVLIAVGAAEEEVRAIREPVREVLSRRFIDEEAGTVYPSSAVIGTSRFSDLIGGEAEKGLLNSINKLIEALNANTSAELAVKEALRPFNLDENLRGLNTRARVSIKRSKREREDALADFINSQFDSPGFSSFQKSASAGSLFGFGGSPFDSILRDIAFGGREGFRRSLPGEGRRPDDDFVRTLKSTRAEFFGPVTRRPLSEGVVSGLLDRTPGATFAKEFLDAIAADPLGLLRPTGTSGDAGRGGLIDLGDLLPGATGTRGKVRGRKDPFSGSGSVASLRDAILDLASEAFDGPRGKGEGRKLVTEITGEVADAIGETGDSAASQVKILEGVLDKLTEIVDLDKEAKDRSDKEAKIAEKVAEAEEKLADARKERGLLEESLSGVGAKADESVSPVDEAAIRDRIASEESRVLKELLAPLEEVNLLIESLSEEIRATNEEAIAQITEEQTRFVELFGIATDSIDKLATTAIDTMKDSADISEKFIDVAYELVARQTEVQKQVKAVNDAVDRLKAQIGNKTK